MKKRELTEIWIPEVAAGRKGAVGGRNAGLHTLSD
jgi:hypothetical protein